MARMVDNRRNVRLLELKSTRRMDRSILQGKSNFGKKEVNKVVESETELKQLHSNKIVYYYYYYCYHHFQLVPRSRKRGAIHSLSLAPSWRND
jgi:hypothetical protein